MMENEKKHSLAEFNKLIEKSKQVSSLLENYRDVCLEMSRIDSIIKDRDTTPISISIIAKDVKWSQEATKGKIHKCILSILVNEYGEMKKRLEYLHNEITSVEGVDYGHINGNHIEFEDDTRPF